MLINLSNHPYSKWSVDQTEAANRFGGGIVDLPFPIVDPSADEDHVAALADIYCAKVMEIANGQPVTVHIMGEMTLTFALVRKLQEISITCVAATTRRETIDYAEGRKESVFRFVRFREYL